MSSGTGNQMNESAGAVISEQHTEFDRRTAVSKVPPRSERRAPQSLRSPRQLRRPSMVPLFLSAVLSLTAVAVADRAEQRLVAPTVAPATGVDATPADAPSASGNASPTIQTPLTSAALPAGEMVLTLSDGSAAISTGANDPVFELGTTRIGDVDLSGVEPVLAQGDAEVSADWGDVTEWYRPAGDGIEHGYTVDAPLSAGDDLTVTVDVVAGEPTLVDGQTVAIERPAAGIVWYRGLFAFDANGIDLPAEMAVVDGDIELRVDTAGAEYPITIDPTISEEQELLALAPDDLEYFGSVGAIDEARGRMIVGGGATATVFELQAGVWTRVQELVPATSGPPPTGLGAQVVSSVDISGDIAVIGSIEFGTVAIYDRDAGGVWELSQTLASGDAGFGAAVGVGDGATVDFIMTGAPEEPWTGTPDPGPNGGRLREYTRTVDGFVETSNGLGTTANSFQGAAVDVEHLGGDSFSYGWTLTGGLNWVIVRTISWNGLSFDETGLRVARYFDAGLGVGSGFGGDLDIEGTGFVVGADAASGAFVYDFDGPVARVSFAPELSPTAVLVPSSGTGPLSVARGTGTVAVGASTAAGGRVELFDYTPSTETWATTGESFDPAGYTPVAGGEYGKFVALSGRVLATGDPLADDAFIDQGRAFTADLAPLLTSGVIVVTGSGDEPDPDPGDGVCDTGSGTCTLRAAIQTSNRAPGRRHDRVRHPWRWPAPDHCAYWSATHHRHRHHRRIHPGRLSGQYEPGRLDECCCTNPTGRRRRVLRRLRHRPLRLDRLGGAWPGDRKLRGGDQGGAAVGDRRQLHRQRRWVGRTEQQLRRADRGRRSGRRRWHRTGRQERDLGQPCRRVRDP